MADETIDPSELAGLVKCVWFNDPNKFRYFTKDAVPLVGPKWVPAEDQSLPENIKKTPIMVARPVVNDQSERINELRKMYVEKGGTDEGYKSWNRGRLEIEVVKLEKLQEAKAASEPEHIISEPEREVSEDKIEEPVNTRPSKTRGRKPKVKESAE